MDGFEMLSFPALGKWGLDRTAAQLKHLVAQFQDLSRRTNRAELYFELPKTTEHALDDGITLSFQELFITLRDAGLISDLSVRITGKRGKQLWQIFINSGYVLGGPIHKAEPVDEKQPESQSLRKDYIPQVIGLKKEREKFTEDFKWLIAKVMIKSGNTISSLRKTTLENIIDLSKFDRNKAYQIISFQLHELGKETELLLSLGDIVSVTKMQGWKKNSDEILNPKGE
jgi:hypothetical protein